MYRSLVIVIVLVVAAVHSSPKARPSEDYIPQPSVTSGSAQTDAFGQSKQGHSHEGSTSSTYSVASHGGHGGNVAGQAAGNETDTMTGGTAGGTGYGNSVGGASSSAVSPGGGPSNTSAGTVLGGVGFGGTTGLSGPTSPLTSIPGMGGAPGARTPAEQQLLEKLPEPGLVQIEPLQDQEQSKSQGQSLVLPSQDYSTKTRTLRERRKEFRFLGEEIVTYLR